MTHHTNLQYTEKILKWTGKMQGVFHEFNIKSLQDFEQNETCQLAINQLVTNVHELTKKIDAELYDHIPHLVMLKRKLKYTRNIADHDYESLGLDIVYKLVTSLTHADVYNELHSAAQDLRSQGANEGRIEA
ncbi:MAG: hypothetical protein FWG38_08455 [Defluviitaleaceae bacterium]|nr:hypothetical protein [Defluviitaleaceae bacterium]